LLQIIAAWNLVHPQDNMAKAVSDIKLRGNNKETFLTGEFANGIASKKIRCLSVSNIADKHCPTRRDLYFYKGINRLRRAREQQLWGNKAGYIVEEYVESVLRSKAWKATKAYSEVIKKRNGCHSRFIKENRESLNRLEELEVSPSVKEGDTDWLLTLLSHNGRAELGLNILHSLLKENDSLDAKHVQIKEKVKSHPTQIGMNSPVIPDFIIPEFGIVGDIKTGVEFAPFFQLTCAGYALAYENENGHTINWGIIYFFPTRNPSAYVRPITFAQVYIFPIDDELRQWFLDIRDEAYRIISRRDPPSFPDVDKRKTCLYCKFRNHCVDCGLELQEQ